MLEGKLPNGHEEISLPAFDPESIFGPPMPKMENGDDIVMGQDERTRASSIASSSSTPPPSTPVAKPNLSRRRTQPEPISRIFIKDLPDAEHVALRTFTELRENDFQTKGLGRSCQQEEMMVCDCSFDESESGTQLGIVYGAGAHLIR